MGNLFWHKVEITYCLKERMYTSLQKRWLVDAVLFTGFLSCFFLDLTGVGLHQWLGLAAGAVAAYHLLSHWSWVSAVSRRFIGKTSAQARLYLLIDALLLAGFSGMIVTGLVISTWLDLSLAAYATWRAVHIVASVETLLVLVLKIGLHGRWILAVGKQLFGRQAAHRGMSGAHAAGDRRAFIKLMAGIGAASLLAISQPFQNANANADADELASASETVAEEASTSTTTRSTGSSASSTSGCVLQCGRRCSYPGHCRRYVDQNSNGRCDLGECQR